MIGRLLLIAAIFFGISPAAAQFADQATAIQSVAGTNTITGTLPNALAYSDVLNVLVKLTPAAGNTSATTLNLNSIGPIAINKPTLSGLVALTGTELVAGQPNILMYNGSVFVLLSVTSTTVAAGNLGNSALGFNAPPNIQINGTVGSNQLTIAIKGGNGSDASATNSIPISFRDVTIANGDPAIVSLQNALSFTIASGSTMGCVNSQMCRLWIVIANNAGTPVLCAFNALNGNAVYGLQEYNLMTSTGGTSGGNNAWAFYCNASVSAKAYRIVGYVEISETTAGTWATGPVYIQLFGPGSKKPGDIVQRIAPAPISSQTTLLSSQTQTGITASITLSSAANIVDLSSNVNVLGGAGSNGQVRFSRGTGPTLLGESSSFSCAAQTCVVPVHGTDILNSTSPTSYFIFGISSANNIIVNDAAATFAPTSGIVILEIMSSLKPANDNQPLRMVG